MLVLLVSQLALIIYVWVDHVQIQQSLEKIVQTIWDQRKTDALLMDTLERSVSSADPQALHCEFFLLFTSYSMKIVYCCSTFIKIA